jgi:hypothetical protein
MCRFTDSGPLCYNCDILNVEVFMDNQKKRPKDSQARIDARKRWAEAHPMQTIGCRLYDDEAEAFKKYAKERGTTASKILSGYIRRCLAADQAEKQQQSGTD